MEGVEWGMEREVGDKVGDVIRGKQGGPWQPYYVVWYMSMCCVKPLACLKQENNMIRFMFLKDDSGALSRSVS